MLSLVLLVIVLVLFYVCSNVVKPKRYPPGPKWYPFFGCSSIIQSRLKKYGSQWKVISEMAKKYRTNILGLKLGNELVVVVYGEKNIRHVTTEKEFDARPDSFFLRMRTFGKRRGITFVDGPLWREHRHFALKNLRSCGFGKLSMEFDIQSQLNCILEYLEKSNGSPTSVRNSVAVGVVNVVWKYVAGEHIKEDNLKQFMYLMSARLKAFTMAGGYLNQWPWLRFFFPNGTGYTIIKKMNEQILKIIQDSIEKHKNNTIEGNDYMYSFLSEMYASKESYTEDQLTAVCLDILIAASNTVSSVMDFAIISLIHHPDIQDKIYKEINRVLGDSAPSWADNGRLIYTSAFLYEVQRYYSIARFSGGRKALVDVEIDGYVIPKGATVLMSLGDLHNDPQIWNRPDEFMPERFIDEHGALNTTVHLYPFSLGRRRCPGEPLAKSFLFMTCVGILQKYRIISDGTPPSTEPVIGLLAEPKRFTALFVKRQL